jgi:hypothetical protein
MYRRDPAELLNELRYSLRVLEERSHLGLNDEAADRVGQILLRQISMLESALASDSVESTTTAATIPEDLEG